MWGVDDVQTKRDKTGKGVKRGEKRKLNWITWLSLWIIGSLPSAIIIVKAISKLNNREYIRESVNSLIAARFLIGLIIGIIAIGANVPDAYMVWVLAFWIILWTMIELLITEIHTVVKAFSVFLLIIFIASGVMVLLYSGYNNAIYFDKFIKKADGFPIQNEIPDNLIRLTTEELAMSITKQHMSEFGSNVEIVDMQVTMYEGKLSWVSLISRHEDWGLLRKVEGLVIIDAANPDKPPKILKGEKFAVADGLSFNPVLGAYSNAKAVGYYGLDTALAYGDVYPALTPEGKWVTAMTTFQPDWQCVRRYSGIYILDQSGDIIQRIGRDDIPDWLVQVYDEQTFLEHGINDWGSHRRGNDFDLWAPGGLWFTPSNDRVEISEDTRYVYDPDTKQVVAMVMVHPVRQRGEFSLAGAFKVTSKGIFYYDLNKYDFISGVAAGSVVKSKITQRVGTEHITAMELLYPMEVGNATKHVWFVPIYFKNLDTGLMGLAGLGLVDAQEQNKIYIELTETSGATGSELVAKAKAGFRTMLEGKPPIKELPKEKVEVETVSINGTLSVKYEPYNKAGYTYQWLTLQTADGKTIDVLVNANLISDVEMLKINKIKLGEQLTVEVDMNNVVRKVP